MKNHLVGAIILLLALLLVGVVAIFAFDTVDTGMPFTGVLANSSGVPVPDASFIVYFRICTDSIAGQVLWSELDTVQTKAGVFSVMLGKNNRIPDSAYGPEGGGIWLGVQVGLDAEMTPRTKLGATPFARFSRGVNGHIVTGPGVLKIPDSTMNTAIEMKADSNGGSLELKGYSPGACFFKLDAHGFTSKGVDGAIADTLLFCSDSMSMKEADWPHAKVTLAPSGLTFRDSLGNPTGMVPNDFNGSGGGSCWNCPGHYTILSDINDSVGIGTATPTAKLEVAGDIRSTTRGIFGPGSGVSGTASFAAGDNCHATADWTSVGGGHDNNASALGTVVAGGNTNSASTSGAAVLGGYLNVAGGTDAAVGGGAGNQALGPRSAIPGGYANNVTGGTSFAAGDQCHVSGNWSAALGSLCEATANLTYAIGNRADAHHAGAVVISANSSTSMGDTISSTGDEQMVLRADGGFYMGKSVNIASIPGTDFLYTSTGAHLTNGGAWTNASDVNAKENFAAVDGADVLARLADMAISEWNYKAEDPSIRHIGPTAQDFHRQFGVGSDDKSISTIDPAGIALVAIKELDRRTTELSAMSSRVQQLEAQIAALQAMVAKLVDEKR